MPELRWVLLLIGVLVVVVVYAWGRRSTTSRRDAGVYREPPSLGDLDDPIATTSGDIAAPYSDETPAVAEPRAAAESTAPEAEKVVTMHLVAGDQGEFPASELVGALRAEGLRFGRYDIFHRFIGEGNPSPASQAQFSVANMHKPGTFELARLRDATLKGVSFFLVLPGPSDPVAAFADMLATGRRLAATLGGQLVDGQGCHVTRQSASHMREDIINHQHAAKIAGEQRAHGDV